MIETFGIPLAFLIITTLTLWIIIGSKGWWWLKAITIIGVIFFSTCLWKTLGSLQGWPTDETLPNKFEIKWSITQEPNKLKDSKGFICMWIINLDKEKEKSLPIFHNIGKDNKPRSYIVPYSRELHHQLEKIKRQIAKGKRFYAKKEPSTLRKRGGKHGFPSEPRFHQFPPLLPEKTCVN